MNGKTKKLVLSKETLRNLADAELRQVVGGVAFAAQAQGVGLAAQPVPAALAQRQAEMITGSPCVCASTCTDTGGFGDLG